MKLPPHKLEELDYYTINTNHYIGQEIIRDDGFTYTYYNKRGVLICLYWKKKKFLGIPYRPKRTKLIFPHRYVRASKTSWEAILSREAAQLKVQLDEWIADQKRNKA